MVQASAFDIFGTDEPVAETRLLTAGPLTAILEEGNLRYIRYGDVEIIRAINYLARDGSWGTLRAELSNLTIIEEKDFFSVVYDGMCESGASQLAYRMKIEGRSSGVLSMEAHAVALTDFETNRTGFVVLHPSDVAGGELIIGHTNGTIEKTVFPTLVMADQPAYDIASLTHRPSPGMLCKVSMEGDAFEMEDQRNWTDASFKTYVRPLAKPRPYTMAKGAKDRQRIEIAIQESPPPFASRTPNTQLTSTLRPTRKMSEIALFIDESVPDSGYGLDEGSASLIILRLDPSRPPEHFVDAAGKVVDAKLPCAVEVIFEAIYPEEEARVALATIEDTGMRPVALLATCRRDFKSRPSGFVPPGEAAVSEVIKALRRSGFQGPIGAGTPSNFTEFNRNPPPPDCDFIYFAVSAIIHAADDLSVVETLQAFPDVIESARALCPGKPIWLGPCTLAPRHNPYGQNLVPNPSGKRVAAAEYDPRQVALFGAAFAVGVTAMANRAGVDVLCLAAPTGPFGIVDGEGKLLPIGLVHRELAEAARVEWFDLDGSAATLHGLSWRHGGSKKSLVSNLSGKSIRVELSTGANARVLTQTGWVSFDTKQELPAYRTFLILEGAA